MKFFKGFTHATRGIRDVFRSELNFKVHTVLLGIVVFLGIFFRVSVSDWVTLILVSSLVLTVETINTAIEKVCNEITAEHKESIRFIKDVSAAAVLLISIAAAIIGCLIFWKYIKNC